MKKLKIIFLLFSLLAFSGSIFSQNFANKQIYLIDSLQLDALAESDRLLIDSIIPLYHKAKQDSLKLSYVSQIVELCYDDNVWPKYNQWLFKESQEKLTNPLLPKKEAIFMKKVMASTINNKGYLAYSLGKYNKAIEYYQLSFNLYQEIHDKDGLATCLNNIGSIYDDRGNTEEALKYYLSSLNFVEQIGDKHGIALASNNIGYIYSDKGQVGKALEYYRRSIKLLEEIGDKQVLATTFNNVGYIYKMQGDAKKALEYYKKCLDIFEEIGYEEGIAGSLNNIGQIYASSENTNNEALECYEKSVKIQKELGHKKGEAETSNNIGVLYENKGELDRALDYYLLSLKIREEIGDKVGQAHSLGSIGNVKLLQGELQEAKINSLRGYKLAQELGFPNIIRQLALVLSNVYGKEKDPVNELKMYRLYIAMSDSVSNEATKKEAIKHDIQYKFEKQALTDSLNRAVAQNIKDLKYDQEIKQQKTYTIAGVVGFGLMILVVVVVFRGYQQKKKNNFELEEKNKVIEEKNNEITDSINYAKRIQNAIIPSHEEINQHLKNAFVFFKPKDIVAGDFYWLQKLNNEIIYAAADCTGHGVPGAMISVVCHNALNRSVREYKLIEPAAILDKTKELVIDTFQRSREDNHMIRDGMDIALCSINYENNTLQYSGANNSLYIIRNGELLETKPDKQPIGRHHQNSPFTNHLIEIKKDDCIYTFSDGYADQFGGPKGKKFMYKKFKKLLISISHKNMEEQKEILSENFEEWKGELDQIDDVCIIGVKI